MKIIFTKNDPVHSDKVMCCVKQSGLQFFQAVRGKDNIAINGEEEDGGIVGHSEVGISEPEEDEEEVGAR